MQAVLMRISMLVTRQDCLHTRLRELGFSADTPTDFFEKAKGIVFRRRRGALRLRSEEQL